MLQLRQFFAPPMSSGHNGGLARVCDFSVSCNVFVVCRVLSDCLNVGEFGETPMPGAFARGRTIPSQAGGVQTTPGVCNEHVPTSKEKICSALHGNMQKSAEMTDSSIRTTERTPCRVDSNNCATPTTFSSVLTQSATSCRSIPIGTQPTRMRWSS